MLNGYNGEFSTRIEKLNLDLKDVKKAEAYQVLATFSLVSSQCETITRQVDMLNRFIGLIYTPGPSNSVRAKRRAIAAKEIAITLHSQLACFKDMLDEILVYDENASEESVNNTDYKEEEASHDSESN